MGRDIGGIVFALKNSVFTSLAGLYFSTPAP